MNYFTKNQNSMKSMLLVTSSWGPAKTFKMIPTTNDCPYNECIFDVQSKVLAIIGKVSKESFHMMPKLDDKGDIMRLKIGKKEDGKDYAEERKILSTFYEYYITDKKEIEDFVVAFAVNADSFDFVEYIDLEVPKEGPVNNIITSL
jgi:hypothetical protein